MPGALYQLVLGTGEAPEGKGKEEGRKRGEETREERRKQTGYIYIKEKRLKQSHIHVPFCGCCPEINLNFLGIQVGPLERKLFVCLP